MTLARASAAEEIVQSRRAKDRERKRLPRNSSESEEIAEFQPEPLSLDKSPQTPKINPNPTHTQRARKATRLDPNWKLPEEWRAYARSERNWSEAEIDAEAENFADYWHAKPKDATKLDWLATWRRWCRESRRPNGKSTPSAAQATPEDKIKTLTDRGAFYRKIGRDDDAKEAEEQAERIRRSTSIGDLTQQFRQAAH